MVAPYDRREVILTTAARLFAHKGVKPSTIRMIADAVDITSGSLYHHFDSKDAIVREVLGRYLTTLSNNLVETLQEETDSATRLHNLVFRSLEVSNNNLYAATIYQNELHYLNESPRFDPIHVIVDDIQRTWRRVIEGGVRDGSFRLDLDATLFHNLIRDAVWFSVRYYHSSDSHTTETLAAEVTAIFLHGFSAT